MRIQRDLLFLDNSCPRLRSKTIIACAIHQYNPISSEVQLELANDPGKQSVVQGQSTKTVRFGLGKVKNPDQLNKARLNLDLFVSTHGLCPGLLDMPVPIPCSSYWVFVFVVAYRYRTANCKILTLVCYYPFLMYWVSISWNTGETCCLPHPENESQRQVSDCRSCILGNQSGKWMQMFINKVQAIFVCKRECDTLPAPLWN